MVLVSFCCLFFIAELLLTLSLVSLAGPPPSSFAVVSPNLSTSMPYFRKTRRRSCSCLTSSRISSPTTVNVATERTRTVAGVTLEMLMLTIPLSLRVMVRSPCSHTGLIERN